MGLATPTPNRQGGIGIETEAERSTGRLDAAAEAIMGSQPETTPADAANGRAPIDQAFRERVDQAENLLTFASVTGRSVDDATIQTIANAITLAATGGSIAADVRAGFEKAYASLSSALAPVTSETLRATDDRQGRRFLWSRFRISEARIWSRKLTMLTAVVAAFILISENVNRIIQDEDLASSAFGTWLDRWVVWAGILQSLTPFAYGTFGACAYLLRTSQKYIHRREFNPTYIPEYFTRLLLGGVSGAAILLFTDAIATGDGAVKVSASALAFIAGYSNDLLFNFIERVVSALFPKTADATSSSPGSESNAGPATKEPARTSEQQDKGE
jgi:hypothetical protein